MHSAHKKPLIKHVKCISHMLLRKLKKRDPSQAQMCPWKELGQQQTRRGEGFSHDYSHLLFFKTKPKKVSQMNTRRGKNYKKLISKLD